MGLVTSLPCCVERSKEARQLQPAKVVSTKISSIINKLGTFDEFSETVRQLNSPLPLTQANTSFKHPWADAPVSVAAQGAVIMAARLRSTNEPEIRIQYWKAGCITPLLNILIAGRDQDRVHASIIALQALTDNCSEQELLDEVVQLDGIAILCKWMKASSSAEGVRMCAATTIRNIVGSSKQYKSEFFRSGGLKALVPLLQFDKKRIADDQYTQWLLERVNDVRDYLDDGGGKVDDLIAKQLVAEGVRSKLEALKASSDNDIIEDSIDVLKLIEKF